MIMAPGLGYAKAHHRHVQKRGLGQFNTAASKVIADVKAQLVDAQRQIAALGLLLAVNFTGL